MPVVVEPLPVTLPDVPAASLVDLQTTVAEGFKVVQRNYLPFSSSIDMPAAIALFVGAFAAICLLCVIRAFFKWTCLRYCPKAVDFLASISIEGQSLIGAGSVMSDGHRKGGGLGSGQARPRAGPPSGAARSPPRPSSTRSPLRR